MRGEETGDTRQNPHRTTRRRYAQRE
jgi:hypothetical protein